MPELPDLSQHPSPVIQELSPLVTNLYNAIDLAIADREQVESLQAILTQAATDILSNSDFHSFDHVIHTVSTAVNNALK